VTSGMFAVLAVPAAQPSISGGALAGNIDYSYVAFQAESKPNHAICVQLSAFQKTKMFL